MRTTFLNNSLVSIIIGLLAIIFGILAFTNPEATVLAIATYFGIFLLLAGILILVASLSRRRSEYSGWWFWIIEAIFDIVIGLIVIAYPKISVSVLMVFIGIWVLIAGIMQMTAYYRLKHAGVGSAVILIGGILSLVFGILFLFRPFEGAMALGILLGIYALIFGFIALFRGLRFSKI